MCDLFPNPRGTSATIDRTKLTPTSALRDQTIHICLPPYQISEIYVRAELLNSLAQARRHHISRRAIDGVCRANAFERRLALANTWGIVPEEPGHGLLEVAVVLVGIFLDIERFGRGAAPHELFGSRVEQPDSELADVDR